MQMYMQVLPCPALSCLSAPLFSAYCMMNTVLHSLSNGSACASVSLALLGYVQSQIRHKRRLILCCMPAVSARTPDMVIHTVLTHTVLTHTVLTHTMVMVIFVQAKRKCVPRL